VRETSFPLLLLEAGPRRTFSQVPRSESTGGASGLAEGNPLRRQGQIGKGDDAGGGLVFFQDPEIASLAESGAFLHHTPDEGATFTLLSSAESANRGAATATPYSASRQSTDASPRGLPNSGADFNIRAANQVSLKQSAPGLSNVAGAGITQRKDLQSDIRASEVTYLTGCKEPNYVRPVPLHPHLRPHPPPVLGHIDQAVLLPHVSQRVRVSRLHPSVL